jgi:predicted ArsR family transcriptional regulator
MVAGCLACCIRSVLPGVLSPMTATVPSTLIGFREESVTDEIDDQIAAVASIAEPQRRNLYRFVGASEQPVSKDEAAEALGLARSVAAFHLDRLVADGLLLTEFRRRSGRQGPGAGRPAKLYRRAQRDVAVSLPARRYGLAADLLAAAVTTAMATGGEVPVDRALRRAARKQGRDLGRTVADLEPEAGLLAVLEAQGYEPRRREGEIVLVNCPFHALVAEHRELVCTMNLDLLSGVVSALPKGRFRARLQPADDVCCVRLTDAG